MTASTTASSRQASAPGPIPPPLACAPRLIPVLARNQVHVHRGGIVILPARYSWRHLTKAGQPCRPDRYPTIDDPAR